jgi:hypothetical protein
MAAVEATGPEFLVNTVNSATTGPQTFPPLLA